jgi:hypothetical protein
MLARPNTDSDALRLGPEVEFVSKFQGRVRWPRLGTLLPTVAEYQADMGVINKDGSKVYRYMNFDQIEEYAETAKGVTV